MPFPWTCTSFRWMLPKKFFIFSELLNETVFIIPPYKSVKKRYADFVVLYLLKQRRNKSDKLSNFLICCIVKPKRERRLKTFFPFLMLTRSCLAIPTNLNTKLGNSTMISTNQVDWGGLFVYSVSNWQWGAFGWSFVFLLCHCISPLKEIYAIGS